MLKAVGADNIDDLFSDIPKEIQTHCISGLPDALPEIDIEKKLELIGSNNIIYRQIFAGGGAYNHYVSSCS
jgi:glycine dehydrogenase subunit 1